MVCALGINDGRQSCRHGRILLRPFQPWQSCLRFRILCMRSLMIQIIKLLARGGNLLRSGRDRSQFVPVRPLLSAHSLCHCVRRRPPFAARLCICFILGGASHLYRNPDFKTDKLTLLARGQKTTISKYQCLSVSPRDSMLRAGPSFSQATARTTPRERWHCTEICLQVCSKKLPGSIYLVHM